MLGARTACAGAGDTSRLTVGRRHRLCAGWGSMTMQPQPEPKLPHHTLDAYQLCLELVRMLAATRISDTQLRQQARKSAASAALNAAEGAARESAGDKRRSFGIANGEACEAAAAVEIAGALGACSTADVQAVVALVLRIRRVFRPLVR